MIYVFQKRAFLFYNDFFLNQIINCVKQKDSAGLQDMAYKINLTYRIVDFKSLRLQTQHNLKLTSKAFSYEVVILFPMFIVVTMN